MDTYIHVVKSSKEQDDKYTYLFNQTKKKWKDRDRMNFHLKTPVLIFIKKSLWEKRIPTRRTSNFLFPKMTGEGTAFCTAVFNGKYFDVTQ